MLKDWISSKCTVSLSGKWIIINVSSSLPHAVASVFPSNLLIVVSILYNFSRFTVERNIGSPVKLCEYINNNNNDNDNDNDNDNHNNEKVKATQIC